MANVSVLGGGNVARGGEETIYEGTKDGEVEEILKACRAKVTASGIARTGRRMRVIKALTWVLTYATRKSYIELSYLISYTLIPICISIHC